MDYTPTARKARRSRRRTTPLVKRPRVHTCKTKAEQEAWERRAEQAYWARFEDGNA